MTQRLIVIGGGEHARVVMDAVRTRPDLWDLAGFVDERSCEETERMMSVHRLGDDAFAMGCIDDHVFILGVGAVGVSEVRRNLVERYGGARFAVVVHARAWVSPTARLARGTVVLAGATVNAGASLGTHNVVNTGAIVEHDCHLGDFVSLGPGVAVGGGTSIGDDSYVGLGSCVRDHVTIGARATVAMGAVVVADVVAGASVRGLPARAED